MSKKTRKIEKKLKARIAKFEHGRMHTGLRRPGSLSGRK